MLTDTTRIHSLASLNLTQNRENPIHVCLTAYMITWKSYQSEEYIEEPGLSNSVLEEHISPRKMVLPARTFVHTSEMPDAMSASSNL